MANEIGKKYKCDKCGAKVIVTKSGNGTVHCCNQPMKQEA
jgi:desulfoferrodoxin-like iron-binding protein